MPYSTQNGHYYRLPRKRSVKNVPVVPMLQDALDHADQAIHARRVKDADRVRAATDQMLGEHEPYQPVKPLKAQPDLFDPK